MVPPARQSAQPGAPLTLLQQGMLYHHLLDPRGGVDIEQLVCTLPEVVDGDLLRAAWAKVVLRHDALRTSWRWSDPAAPAQDVHDAATVPFRLEDWTGVAAQEVEARRQAFLREDRRRGFALDRAPLLRVTLIRLAPAQHELIWTFHHGILDGHSMVLVLHEVFSWYDALRRGAELAPAPALQFGEYLEWYRTRDWTHDREFWTDMLRGVTAATPLPVMPFRSVPAASTQGDRVTWLTHETTLALAIMATNAGVTLATVVHGAWAVLLAAHAEANDVLFGVVRSGHRLAIAGADSMVGLLLNTQPLRIRVDPALEIGRWLQGLQRQADAIRPFERTPLSVAQAPNAENAGASLIDTAVIVEPSGLEELFRAQGGGWEHRRIRLYEQNGFLLTLTASGGTRLMLQLEYDTSRFDVATIDALLEQLRAVCEEFSRDPTRRVGDLTLLSPAARRQLVYEWNDTAVEYPVDAVLHQLLAERAAQCPDAIAVTSAGATLTYRELDSRAELLAGALAVRGVGPGVLVGVCMERSLDLIVALVGILKAGGAYVPMDPGYPVERLAFMLRDASCSLLLSDERTNASVLDQLLLLPASGGTEILCLDRDWEQIVAGSATAGPRRAATPDDAAYMIYTSGSTGKPKGAVNRHRGVVNFLRWTVDQFHFDGTDTVLQKTPVSFDWSVPEIFSPLLAGARLVLAQPGEHRDPARLAAIMGEHGVTVAFFVPSMLNAFLDAEPGPTRLRDVLCSGEPLPVDLQERFFAQFPDTRLHNLFGPTETAVEATHWACQRNDLHRTVPIGRPLANTHLYVLDAECRPVPIGVTGELFIGGVQVGAGYHGRPELTAERFVPDPFVKTPGGRLYRTGDRGRWLSDGTLEHLGRVDFQVKLRGHRIEIGEIESTIAALDGIRECAVVLRSDPGIDPHLVAYYVPRGEAQPSISSLRAHLAQTLPDYMVPSFFVPLDALPLTPAGKLDRSALSASTEEAQSSAQADIAPRDELEARVLKIWQQVLGARKFGVESRFTEVGGNSLAAVRVFSSIGKEFGREIPLATMLEHDTVAKHAAVLRDSAAADEWRSLVPFTTSGAGTPIFCPHAQTGNILIYQHFAKAMAGDHPVYALQALGNWGDQEPHESIEEMAAHYVEQILQVRPHGPYIFFGYSMGGLIALELAHAMRARGEEVELLAMYDTAGPGYPRLTRYGRIVKYVREHGGISFGRLRRIFEVDPGHRRSGWLTLRNIRDTARWWYDNTRRDWLSWRFEKRNPPRGFVMPSNCTRFRLASKRIEARYQPRFYPGKITIYRAEIQQFGAIYDPAIGWQGRAAELEIHPVPLGHNGGIHPPHVDGFVKLFRTCLANR